MPNTHRRRRRDETVLSRRVGVGGVYMNSRRLPTDSAMRTHNAAVWVTTADGCVHTDDTTKLSPTSCEFVYTPPTPRDSTVSSRRSRRRRRCVLGFRLFFKSAGNMKKNRNRKMSNDMVLVPDPKIWGFKHSVPFLVHSCRRQRWCYKLNCPNLAMAR